MGGEWATADQAASVRLPDGRYAWLFGDTVQGTLTRRDGALAVSRWVMPHSSAVVTSGTSCRDTRVVTGPRRTSLLPDAANGEVHWPMAAVVDGGQLHVFAQRVRLTPHQGFTSTGTRLAALHYRDSAGRPATPAFSRWQPTPSTGVAEDRGIQWGAAVERSGSHLYVYGTRGSKDPMVFGKSLHVARVPVGRLGSWASWRYWDGRSWVTGSARAVAVKEAAGGVSTSLSVDRVGERWVAVTKKDEFLGREIVVLTAERPTGPWRETRIATTDTDADLEEGDVTYTALGHPDIPLTSGRMLVSVSRNNLDSRRTLRDVERGRPYFFEAGLPVR